jgi:hypothetical protein
MVPFEVPLQVVGLDEASLAVLSRTYMGTVVVMNHRVMLQIRMRRESGPTVRDIASIRPFTRMNTLVFGGIFRTHLLATPPEPTEHLPVLQALPLRSPSLTGRNGRFPN